MNATVSFASVFAGDFMISLSKLAAMAFLQGANLFYFSLCTLSLSFPLFWFHGDGPCLDRACKLQPGSQNTAHHLFYSNNKNWFRQYLNTTLHRHTTKRQTESLTTNIRVVVIPTTQLLATPFGISDSGL